MSEPQGLDARRGALDLICAVVEDERLLSEVAVAEALSPEDRARAERLAAQTLRWAQRSDRVLGPHLRMLPWPRTHAILRLGVWEMLGDGAAAHGVVNAAVALAREDNKTKTQAGLVNAVLRKVVANPPDWSALPLPELPKWLRKPLVQAYGRDVVARIEAAHAAGAPLDLTPNPRATLEFSHRRDTDVLPTGSRRLKNPGAVTALPGYSEGAWWVQDAAAALPARILDAQPEEHVVEFCAAPGGKTLQLAASGAQVTAIDISDARLGRLRDNLARTKLTATVVAADVLTWTPPTPPDAILLDAPCSATGTIRRHPDLPFVKADRDIKELRVLQKKMLDRALEILPPGGRLVFCTCSLLPEEGEHLIQAMRDKHRDLAIDHAALAVPGVEAAWIGPEGLRLRPDYWSDRGGMDGFFVTLLRKPARS